MGKTSYRAARHGGAQRGQASSIALLSLPRTLLSMKQASGDIGGHGKRIDVMGIEKRQSSTIEDIEMTANERHHHRIGTQRVNIGGGASGVWHRRTRCAGHQARAAS